MLPVLHRTSSNGLNSVPWKDNIGVLLFATCEHDFFWKQQWVNMVVHLCSVGYPGSCGRRPGIWGHLGTRQTLSQNSSAEVRGMPTHLHTCFFVIKLKISNNQALIGCEHYNLTACYISVKAGRQKGPLQAAQSLVNFRWIIILLHLFHKRKWFNYKKLDFKNKEKVTETPLPER